MTSMFHAETKQGAAGKRGALDFVARHKWALLLFALVLAGGAYEAPVLLYGPLVQAERVARSDLVETVVASGHVETPYRVEIGSQITGTVSDVLVEEGQRVQRGQTLITLESSELKGAVVQAQGAVEQAQARMKQLEELTLPSAKEALLQAQATLANAQRAFDRAARLAQTGYGTQATLDDATKALDISRTLVRTAQLQVYTSSPGGSDYVMAQTQLAQAQANLTAARSRLAYAAIAAPRAGVLISRSVERGSVVQPGKALMVLAPEGAVQLVLEIDEKNLGKIRLGEHALVSADAYPDKTFAARVSYINPGIDITRASVEVKLNAIDPPDFLRQDMTVSVDIEVARRNHALVLPTRAVHDLATPHPWVLKIVDGRLVRQPVVAGIRGTDKVEIVSGLAEGDAVVPATSSLRAGQRARLAPERTP